MGGEKSSKAKTILTNERSTNEMNWKWKEPPPQGACATRGGYKTKNGQEVFLWHNGIFVPKNPPTKTPCPHGNPAPKSHLKTE